ncbi:hypothetical protein T484DRAFT_1819792 [Baffinella frigidus]|nr:hypothetical protein T484DRAFT_1819792 [Cryptophyta sp. CCMP2293]
MRSHFASRLSETRALAPKRWRSIFEPPAQNSGIVGGKFLERSEQTAGIGAEALADDAISIFEPPAQNSGIVGGKFLERSVRNNPDTEFMNP